MKEERVAAFSRHPRAAVVRGDAADPAFLASVLGRAPALVHRERDAPPAGRPRAGAAPRSVRGAGIGVFVHLSDGRLYGPRDEAGRRAKEDEALEPGDDVDLVAKAAEEEALLASGVPFVNLRVFSAVGPGGAPARFPLDALEALFGGEEIFLPDDAPRDFVHTEDVVRGILFAIARRPLGETVNLGTGLAVRPSELVRALALRAAREARISVSGESPRPPRIADLEKAWQLSGLLARSSGSARSRGRSCARACTPKRPGAPCAPPETSRAPRGASAAGLAARALRAFPPAVRRRREEARRLTCARCVAAGRPEGPPQALIPVSTG